MVATGEDGLRSQNYEKIQVLKKSKTDPKLTLVAEVQKLPNQYRDTRCPKISAILT
jgi:hypothetical protein